MSPAVLSESPITLAEAARQQFPTHPNPATVWRWANHGVNGVKLETATVGGRKYTSAAAVERFIALTNQGAASCNL